MSFGQKETDKEWPTFNYDDIQVSYSPNDGENENDNIFTEFKPATEFHNIRNKKRKPKNARALRLISESEINRKNKSCCQDRKRCVVISVLVTCIIIIIAICIFLGIYFGVILKGKVSSSKSHSDSSVEVVTLSSTKIPPSPPPTAATSKKTTTTTQPRPTVPLTTKPPPPKTTTSSTTTTTTTTSTTTTTTTTTTPVPTTTEPPVRHFTGSDDDMTEVIRTAKYCTGEIIYTTEGLNQDQKCSLYFEMLRCVYVVSTSNLLHVPVHILGEIMENRTREIFPLWIEINPQLCKVNGTLDIGNISALPLKLSELCSSPDAILFYGKRDCRLVQKPDVLAQESDENKCRVRWGTIWCVANTMSCPREEIEETIDLYESDVTDELYTANKMLCKDMYESISQSSPCVMILYRYMDSIYRKCSSVIQQGSQLNTAELACPLFEVFFECSYTHIPSLMRYEMCELKKNDLRTVTFDIAQTLSKVDTYPKYFINISSCLDTPIFSNNICESPNKLVTMVDTLCYKRFHFVTQATICKVISKYIYECGPQYIKDLGLTCTASQIRAAMISQSTLMFQKYDFNMTNLASQDKCIEPV